MLYVIIGHDAPEAREKRPQVRPAHLATWTRWRARGASGSRARSSTAPAA